LQVRASIGLKDARYRAAKTQGRLPGQGRAGAGEQAAFFLVPAAMIIPIKETAFFTGRCAHAKRGAKYTQTSREKMLRSSN